MSKRERLKEIIYVSHMDLDAGFETKWPRKRKKNAILKVAVATNLLLWVFVEHVFVFINKVS